MRIAVVGSGVSGLVSAYTLGREHSVTLFEADDRLGGHAHTVDVEGPGGDNLALDTGFLVFNPRTYPQFSRLLAELGVSTAESDMSLSVQSRARDFEYGGRDLGSLYAQRRHWVSPRFHRMVWDILRFYREARGLLDASDDVSIGDWLRQRHYSEAFIRDHLVPMVRAVWSAGLEDAERFPARFLVRFFHNHGFLEVGNQPRWLTLPGGSRSYVNALIARFRGELRLGCPVTRVTRPSVGVVLETQSRPAERFDHVVLACHSDQALGLLGDASALERELLSCLPYQDNEAVLHTDERLMPRRRRVWSSWNVHLDDAGADGACLTYWLNSLQPLATKTNYFVTLNHTAAIDPARILRTFRYAHPVFSRGGVAAQLRHQELIDHRSTSYAGAYWRNGFHEDGVVSAQRVCQRLGAHTEEKAA